ncbi:MAG: choice-of-anchor L domain-containing protein [Cyanobacteria bacterium P01_F01_bin.143]
MALTTTNLINWVNDLNRSPEDLVNILVGTGVEVISDSIQITGLPVDNNEENTDPLTVEETVDDVVVTEEDIPVTTVVLDDGTDSLTYPLTLNIVTNVANGTTNVHNDGTITYTPHQDFYGYDSYTYTIDDGNGGINLATVSLQVNPDSAVDDIVTTDEDISITTAVSDNDLELDNPSTVTVVIDGTNGNAIVNANETITYTPEPGFYGTDRYTYIIDDGNGVTRSETAFVTVTPNSTVDNLLITNENTAVSTEILDEDPLTITVTTDGLNGTATVNENGTIIYTPEQNFYGTDRYTYTIDDGDGVIRSETVFVTVNPNSAVDNFLITNENIPFTVAVIDKLTFPTDGINEPAIVSADGTIIDTDNGTAIVNADGTITYIPDLDFNGTDSYAYTINYENGLTSSATVLVSVNPINDEPEAVNDIVITDEDTPVTTVVLDNDRDRDNADIIVESEPEEEVTELSTGLNALRAIGYFEGGLSEDIGIESGIILSTGDIIDAAGPNDSDSTGQGLGTPGDLDLDLILNPNLLDEVNEEDREELPEGDTNDAIVLEFDFIPENEEFVFEYVFASDEYNEFANSSFNDIFAFFLDGENIALIPGTNIPVSINNINAVENVDFFKNNDLDVDDDEVEVAAPFGTEFDGLTTVLGVRGFVIPGQTHHLKLVIADTGDSIYDSAVFLQEGSLSTSPIIADATLTANEQDILTIGGSDEPASAKLKFTLSGTNTDSINEIGVFEVDDDFGSIDGVFPGEADYQQLALTRITSRSIFTALPDFLLDGEDLTRLINFDVGSKLGFYLVSGGTTDMILSNTPLFFYDPAPQVLFGFPEANSNFQDHLIITGNDNGLTLYWEDGVDNDYDDLVVNLEVVDASTIPNSALSSRRQGDLQKEIIDLSILEEGASIIANIGVSSDSPHNNRVGLFRLENAQGAVLDPVTETLVTPDQNNYLATAIGQRVFEFDSNGGGNIELTEGYYAPFIIVGATAEEWLSSNSNNFYAGDTFAYVPFIDSERSIQVNYDRVTLLADNVFGFEDELISEADFDFNDIILTVDLLEDSITVPVDNVITSTQGTNENSLFDTPINRFQNSNVPGTYLYAAEAESQNIRENFPNFIEEGQAFRAAGAPGDGLIGLNRFQNSNVPGSYLYAAEAESQNIRENFPNFVEEGIAFYVYDGAANLGVDFYRLQNQAVPGTYLFVTDAERQNILANFTNFIDEGVAFEAEI